MSSPLNFPFSNGSVTIFGHQPRINEAPEISYTQALGLGAKRGKIAQLIVASDATQTGHKGVYPARYGQIDSWDGTVISGSRAGAIIQTADCPALILSDVKTGTVTLVHAGRPALTPDTQCTSCTVIENALSALLGSHRDYARVRALVVGNICGHCFRHDHVGAQQYIAPFERLPAHVFADRSCGALDLFAVIKHELVSRGIQAEHIKQAGPCTYETPTLSSYRREKSELRNTIIVVTL